MAAKEGLAVEGTASEGPYRKRPAHVIDEPEAPLPPPAVRYPGATICDAIIPRTAPAILRAQLRPGSSPPRGRAAVLREKLALPEGWRLVLLIGRSGAGKTRLLQHLAPTEWMHRAAQSVDWDRCKAVVSHFGKPAAAGSEWLSLVGLNSVPSWGHPHHALSTGQGYRAELARRLQQAQQQSGGLVVDDFGCFLDRQTAACCASSLGRAIRRMQSIPAIVCCNDPQISNWLQPDVLVMVGEGGTFEVVANPNSCGLATTSVEYAQSVEWTAAQAPPFVQPSSLPSSVCWTPQDSTDDLAADVVLVAKIEPDAATHTCDAFFDTESRANCEFVLPAFPAELSGNFPVGGIGMICGPSGSGKLCC